MPAAQLAAGAQMTSSRLPILRRHLNIVADSLTTFRSISNKDVLFSGKDMPPLDQNQDKDIQFCFASCSGQTRLLGRRMEPHLRFGRHRRSASPPTSCTISISSSWDNRTACWLNGSCGGKVLPGGQL